MQIKPPQIRIPEDNPFFEDALNRKESADVLTQMISTIQGPFVLAIDSPWGTGKTTFLQMWMPLLKKKGYPCLYFNAWENDFSDDPLVSLIGEIEAGLNNIAFEGKQKDKAKEYFQKARKFGTTFLKRSLPVAIKIVTAGAVDTDKLTEQALADLAEQIAKEKIEKYEADKSTIQGFRDRLTEFVKELGPTEKREEVKPLIFFIDELDRCRPNYALALLEKVKHFFNVEGIIFVLALDKDQIGHSIRCLYGNGMDVDGYLRRFIDLDYRLSEPSSETFCNFLFNRFGFLEYFEKRTTKDKGYEKDQFLKIFTNLSKIFNFSLRVQEQCFSQLSMVLRTTPPNHFLHIPLLATLIALKVANPLLYRNYVNKSAEPKEVLDYIKSLRGGRDVLDDHKYGSAIEAHLRAGICNHQDFNQLMGLFRKDAETDQRAQQILRFLEYFLQNSYVNMSSYLAKKIEIAERFTGN